MFGHSFRHGCLLTDRVLVADLRCFGFGQVAGGTRTVGRSWKVTQLASAASAAAGACQGSPRWPHRRAEVPSDRLATGHRWGWRRRSQATVRLAAAGAVPGTKFAGVDRRGRVCATALIPDGTGGEPRERHPRAHDGPSGLNARPARRSRRSSSGTGRAVGGGAAARLGWHGTVLPPMTLLGRRVVVVAELLADAHAERICLGRGPVADRPTVATWVWPELAGQRAAARRAHRRRARRRPALAHRPGCHRAVRPLRRDRDRAALVRPRPRTTTWSTACRGLAGTAWACSPPTPRASPTSTCPVPPSAPQSTSTRPAAGSTRPSTNGSPALLRVNPASCRDAVRVVIAGGHGKIALRLARLLSGRGDSRSG